MLYLCPNHHDQFDELAFYIEPSDMEIVELENFSNNKLFFKPRHKVDVNFFAYHKERYKNTND